jgi:hypothetical protein
MKLSDSLLIFFFLVIESFTVNYRMDIQYSERLIIDANIRHFLFFYHLINVYLIHGWYLFPQVINFHVALSFMVIYHWMVTKGSSIFTILYNRWILFEDTIEFYDIFARLNIPMQLVKLTFIMLFLYNLFRISSSI